MSESTRMGLIRSLNAEFVFCRKIFPMGTKGLALRNGVVTPNDDEVRAMVATFGAAAKVGDRAQITDVVFKGHSIIFELNGGPKRKKKWYQHITIAAGGGDAPVVPDRSPENPHGSFVALQFDNYVPEMTSAELKALLTPVFDFTALSATQAYIDTMPPKVREAMKNHEVLVGMNRDMVLYSKGKPPQKVREHDSLGDYEEWIYGKPPEDVEFVRIYGDEVKRVEIMRVGGEKIVRTEPEMPASAPAVAQRNPQQAPAAQPESKRPTMKLPGEEVPDANPAAGPAPARKLPDDMGPPVPQRLSPAGFLASLNPLLEVY